MVYLALRSSNAPSVLPWLFSMLTRWRLHTRFPHAGIVAGGYLYHATFKSGLCFEHFTNSDDWALIEIEGLHCDDVEAWYQHLEGAKYDWFSLLGFILPWRVSKRSWLYCYEWCYLAITGLTPLERITPEMLLSLAIKKGVTHAD